jgi:hypothetical protein
LTDGWCVLTKLLVIRHIEMDHIISLKGTIWAHRTSLHHRLFFILKLRY